MDVSVIAKSLVLPPCVVDGHSRNPLLLLLLLLLCAFYVQVDTII